MIFRSWRFVSALGARAGQIRSVEQWPSAWPDVTCEELPLSLSWNPTPWTKTPDNDCLVVACVCSDSVIRRGRCGQGLWHWTDGAGDLSREKYYRPQSWQIEKRYFLQGLDKTDFHVSAEINYVYFRGCKTCFNILLFRLEIIDEEQISSWSRKYKEASQIRYTPIKSNK